MKKSGIKYALIKFLPRPMFGAALILLVLDLLYVNLFRKSPTYPFENGKSVKLTVTVESKRYNDDGSLKYILLNAVDYDFGLICYVNYSDVVEEPPLQSCLLMEGRLKTFDSPKNPGEFDLKKYYEDQNILYSISNPNMVITARKKFSLKDGFNELRRSFAKNVRKYCPLEGGTINTILFAEKSELPEYRKKLFSCVGLSHFLVISGLHIQALSAVFYSLLKKSGMKRSKCALICTIIVIMYGCLIGFSASVRRAIIMCAMRLFSDIFKRTYDMLTSLSVAFIISVLINPCCILETGFVYSYMAVLAVSLYMEFIYQMNYAVNPITKNDYSRHPKLKRRIPDLVGLPVIIWLFILPISLKNGYSATFLSIILNIFLGVLTTPSLIMAALAFLFSELKLGVLAGLFDFLFAIILRFMDSLCDAFSRLKVFGIITSVKNIQVIVFYVFLLSFVIIFVRQMSEYLISLSLVSFLFIVSFSFFDAPVFTALDVGQGDCLVYQYAPHKAVVVDCGSSSKSNVGERILSEYLKYCSITTVSDFFLTHEDSDHVNGVKYIVDDCYSEGITVKNLVVSNNLDLASENIYEIVSALHKTTKIRTIHAGNRLIRGKLCITCLWPLKGQAFTDPNTDSLVLLLSNGEKDILLTGDCPSESENLILSRVCENPSALTKDGHIEILKAAHHGSKYSCSRQFLDVVASDICIISVGRNSYGHPHKETLERLELINALILRTDTEGAIRIKLSP